MDFFWILVAFGFGLIAKSLSLPPLAGYLIAGFVLHAGGIEPQATLETLADLGITLMLFTIGLKLNLKDLLKREMAVTTVSHMASWILVVGLSLVALASFSLPWLLGLNTNSAFIVAFALSFSSTVCAFKLLEENGELKTRHGKLAIAVLVIQDIIAVLFLVFATGQQPSPYALLLPAVLVLRPLLGRLVNLSGHGELLPLTGFALALGGYELFHWVQIKGDLGALLMGILISNHPKAGELSKSLMHFKDLFLIGFFLSIGFIALPTWEMLTLALLFALLLPLKWLLFFGILVLLKLRARTAFLSALVLSNYSEFGLIVSHIAVEQELLDEHWLVVLAISLSISFVITSLLYRSAHGIYARYNNQLKRLESAQRLPEDQRNLPDSTEVLVIGLGRVGSSAYDALVQCAAERVYGMDSDRQRVEDKQNSGMQAFVADGEDADLWELLDTSKLKLILLAVPSVKDSINIVKLLKQSGYEGQIAAIARYEDESQALQKAGIDKVFNFFTEAGIGFAEESLAMIETPEIDKPAKTPDRPS